MNKEHEKVPRWTWKIAWLLLIVGILVVASTAFPRSFPSLGAGWFTRANYENCHFSSGQTEMTIALQPDKWSCWVVTPTKSDYRIHTEGPIKICFADGYCANRADKTFEDVGLRRGIFQILTQNQDTATITIERK